jgi:hypothetical protein
MPYITLDGISYAVVHDGCFITNDGLDYLRAIDRGKGCYSKTRDAPEREQVELAKKFIVANCLKTKTIRDLIDSYGWKHRCERWGKAQGFAAYVTNGAFLQAAYEMGGIAIKPCRPGCINAWLSLGFARGRTKLCL